MMAPVTVVGLHGATTYGTAAASAVRAASLVVGSPRHLSAAAALRRPDCQVLPLVGPLDAVLDHILAARLEGHCVCVLASGDPGFFGIVRVLRTRLGAEDLTIHPAPSAVALAFARAGCGWDDAAVVSAHGRPLPDAVAAVVGAANPSVAVLTSPATPPETLGRALLDAGEPPGPVTVASHLGTERETVTRTDLAALAAGHFDPMSVVILHDRSPTRSPGRSSGPGLAWGLPESDFAHSDGMITKAEVRAVALGKLGLPPTGVLWDVGAGSGSVAVECARLAPGLRVIAVDRSAAQVAHVRANAVRHGVAVEVVEGEAPGSLSGLPDPDRVFVGGGGPIVLDEVMRRLRPGGRAVATYAIMERAVHAATRLGHLTQIAVSRGVPAGPLGLRLEAANPVFVCWGPDA